MPPRLILNADDFGLTLGINRAIAELHAAGCLTSTTLMATGPAFRDAVEIAQAYPHLGVGCHIVLTDGTPVLPAKEVPTLCPNGRTFRPQLVDFLRDLLLGRIDAAEIERESLAQIVALQRSGIAVTHVDTHKHTHIFTRVARPLLSAAVRSGVWAVRDPFEPAWSIALSASPVKRRLSVRLTHLLKRRWLKLEALREGIVRTTDGTVGVSATGNLNADVLRRILDAAPEGTWEIVCHPGYNDHDLDQITTRLRETRAIELSALRSEVPRIFMRPNAPTIIHYREL
jgi:predicted glycoside hydrolase/deacetylase ChbG (UPF0249 family)